MYYVYILRSINFDQIYTGFTKDLKTRLIDHNAGRSKHTKKYRPWTLISYTAFVSFDRARLYEKYLKTGSGIAFVKRHIL